MPDLAPYGVEGVSRLLAPRLGKGMRCSRCGKVLKGNQKLYMGGLCGKCIDKAVMRK